LANGWMIWGLIPSRFKRFFLFYKHNGTGSGIHLAPPYSEHQGIMWSVCDFDNSSPSTAKSLSQFMVSWCAQGQFYLVHESS
jgi:hypothetical protein